MPTINPLASNVKGIAGVFELRGIPIPAINLAAALGDEKAVIESNQQIIVTEFSNKRAGFIVGTTHRIRRISWDKVLPPTTDKHTCINGMSLIEGNEFLFILDLERILVDIETESEFIYTKNHALTPMVKSEIPRNGSNILVIDDSDLIRNNTSIFLEQAGFDVKSAANGLIAQQILKELLEKHPGGKIPLDVIICDVEMPKMDGLTLTRWIKSQPRLLLIPVILHTSLSGDTNRSAGMKAGANEYIIKNDVSNLLKTIKKFAAA
jgi:two-component system chemotaxis response regulator CheV